MSDKKYYDLLHIENSDDLDMLNICGADLDLSKLYLNKLLRIPSKRQYALIKLGNLEACNENYSHARQYFNTALISSKSNLERAQLHNYLMLCYIKEGNNIAALKEISKMLKNKMDIDITALAYIYDQLDSSFKELIGSFNIDYSIIQNFAYSEDSALGHIITRHSDRKQYPLKTKFKQTIDITKLFYYIKGLLEVESERKKYKIERLEFNDMYVIPFESVGEKENNIIVITRPKTTNIVTMYPISDQFIIDKTRPYEVISEKFGSK